MEEILKAAKEYYATCVDARLFGLKGTFYILLGTPFLIASIYVGMSYKNLAPLIVLIQVIGMLCWVAFCCTVWLIVRNKKPDLLGLGKDLNKQRIDGVKYSTCNNCHTGSLEPAFKWWQYCVGITLPPGIIYILGSPYEYRCTNCAYKEENKYNNSKFTRISLTHRLTKPYFIAIALNVSLGIIFIYFMGVLGW